MKRRPRCIYVRKLNGSVLYEAILSMSFLFALTGGLTWLHGRSIAPIYASFSDRYVSWNRGLENRGYREGFEGQEKSHVREMLFGKSDASSDIDVQKIYYSWRLLGDEKQEDDSAIGSAPPHWIAENWALYHGGKSGDSEQADDRWIGQNVSAVQVYVRTSETTISFLKNALMYGLNRMQREIPAGLSIGGRRGGASEGGEKLMAAACVTMRTGSRRSGLEDEMGESEKFGKIAESIYELLGNHMSVPEEDQ